MSDANRQWYYSVNGENHGPMSEAQIRGLVSSRTIDMTTLVWSAPMTEWLPLAQTELGRPQAAQLGFAPQPTFAPTPGAYPGNSGGPGYAPGMASTASAEPPVTDFMSAVRTCLSKYATFTGRAGRPEFWWFYLFSFLVTLVAGLIDTAISSNNVGILSSIVSLGLFVPQIAAGARRLHDTDRSGWWQLFWFVPLIGWIVVIVFLCQRGTEGQNRFG